MMKRTRIYSVGALLTFIYGIGLHAYGEESSAALSATSQPGTVVAAPGAAPATAVDAPSSTISDSAQLPAFTPAELDELLAPIALYPDALLAQVLISATKPQEVLDGGNWLIANPNLKGKELESAAKAVGFTPPMIVLMSFPSVLDQMCMKMAWTTELGEAVVADQQGVKASIQRLRKQAADMGNLQDSQQLNVEHKTENNQDVIVVTSPDPKVVYVPQYDPATTYTTPAPATTTAAAPSATATATTVTEGHSTTALVTTGLLAFGAGILVNEAFDDDDDDWGGYGGYPYYPSYGGGFYPSNNYNYNKNTNINIDKGDNNSGDRDRPGRDDNKADWKGKNDYAGAKPELRDKAGLADRAPSQSISDRKVSQGSYAGAKAGTRDIAPRPSSKVSDRGRNEGNVARPKSQMDRSHTGSNSAKRMPDKTANAFQGARNGGKQERAASQRGKQSIQRSGGHAGKGGNRAAGRKR